MKLGKGVLGLLVVALVLAGSTRVIRSLGMTRGAVATFTRLVASGNTQDLDAVRSLCSGRYLARHPIERSKEGGVVGFPRVIHKNFQVWVEGSQVWLCPTDRIGPVYRFIRDEAGLWRFDGLVGLLRAGGRVEPMAEALAVP